MKAVKARSMIRVLIITYYWPPSGGSGVQRWLKFSKYLPSEGCVPVIYTPLNPDAVATDESLLADIPQGTEVIKRPITEIYDLYRRLTGKKASKEVNPINQQRKSLFQRLMMFIRGNFFIPDPRVSWVRPSVKFLCGYLKEHPVDVIVTTGPPHSMHLIGRRVSEATGIPWVADFRDPWTKIFYFKHLGLTWWAEKKHERLEKDVLDHAEAVVAVSPLVQKDFCQMTSTRVELITNGYDESDYEGVSPEPLREQFNIVHTGLFASDGDPKALWRALERKCEQDESFHKALRIRLAGKTDSQVKVSIMEHGLGENLEDLGYQPHQLTVGEQLGASILMLPLRREPEYKAVLPGKLFEYLAARKPILGIGAVDGAMADIIRSTHSGVVCDWEDETAISAYIDACWHRFTTGETLMEAGNIQQYSRRAIAAKMAELLKEVALAKKSEI